MKRKKIDIRVIYTVFPLLICIAKIIRYTFMKTILVDNGIGHNWITLITSSLSTEEILSYNVASGANGKAILFYRFFNFFNLDNYYAFEIYISVIYNIILFLIIYRRNKTLISLWDMIFILFSIMVLNIFDFTLAKEPIQMLFFIAIYLVLRKSQISNIKKLVYICIIIALASLIFRAYYILILLYMLISYVFFEKFLKRKEKVKISYIVTFVFVIGFIYFLILTISKSVSYDNYLELLRVRTREADAKTQIVNIFESDNLVLFSLNYIIMFIRMMAPIELLALGPKYMIYVLYQIMITVYIVKLLKQSRKNDDTVNLALYLFLGFLFGSATFEPDFGSWVRHEAILFPIFLIFIEYNNKAVIER